MNLQQLQRTEKYQKILEMKEFTPIEKLCEKSPEEILKFMKYVRGLEFESEPDYAYLRTLFEKKEEKAMDWQLLEEFKMNDISIDNELEKEESNPLKCR